MAFIQYSLVFAAALEGLFLLARGQTTHTVMVGLQGSFFDPPTLSAGLNDTVTFVFAGFIHTVTQSSLVNPCTPLPGGFSSGPAGTLNNDTQHPMTWNLQITDPNQSIWFFCEVTEPTSHCATSGMVGVINPPSIAAYTHWRASAQLVTGTPEPNFAVALTGVGAFATETPTIPSTSVSIPPLSSTSSSSTTPSSTATSSSSSSAPSSTTSGASGRTSTSHLGAIVGGAVGGAVVLILGFIGIIWICRQQKTRAVPTSPASDDANFFRYNPVPIRRPSEAFIEAKQLEQANSATTPSQITPPRALSPDTPISPNRRGQTPLFPPGVPRAGQPLIDRQASFGSTAMSRSAGTSEQPPNINIHALASEVAGLLRAPSNASTAQPSLNPHPEGGRTLRKYPSDSRSGNDAINRTESPLGPPAYRTTVTSPPDSRPST